MWGNSEPFSVWVERTHQQLIARQPADVPCGSCTACCRAGQFIHVSAAEPAFQAIPQELLVPAIGAEGEYLLGHNDDGACPMLVDDRCSIYAERPHTCRTYDCRIFSAADVYPDHTQPEIAARARDWSFENETDQGETEAHTAVKTAALFLRHHAQSVFGTPVNEIQLSLSALKVRDLFQTGSAGFDPAEPNEPLLTAVKALLQP